MYRRLLGEADGTVSEHPSAEVSRSLAAAEVAKDEMTTSCDAPPVDPLRLTRGRCRWAAGLFVSAASAARADERPPHLERSRTRDAVGRVFNGLVPDSLDYLRRGGRIGQAAALTGSLP